MTELILKPWDRFGKSRIYVNTAEGERVGWFDRKTGERTLDMASLAAEFHHEIDQALARESPPASDLLPTQRGRSPEPRSWARRPGRRAQPPESPARRDLAANLAGSSLRVKAATVGIRRETEAGAGAAGIDPMSDDERAWMTGADGEQYVGGRLAELAGYGWGCIHSVPVGRGGADIDHLLVGPGGVVTLNTKNRPNVARVRVYRHQIYCDTHATNYPAAVRDEAVKVSGVLSNACGFAVSVRPGLVILTGATRPQFEIHEDPDDILILDRVSLIPTISQLPPVYDADTVSTVFDHARWSTTWPGGSLG